MLSRFINTLRVIEKPTNLHRWSSTGKSCEIKIKNCSSFIWEDYTSESKTVFVKERNTKKQVSSSNSDKEKPKDILRSFSDEDLMMYASILL